MKFMFITATAVKEGKGVTIYYAAVDAQGRAWWWDSGQPHDQWQPLPEHPDRAPPTSESEP